MKPRVNFDGRANRNEFGRTLVVTGLASIVGVVPIGIGVGAARLLRLDPFPIAIGVAVVVNFLLALTLLPVSFRRIHDVGLSGQWVVLGFACSAGSYGFQFISLPVAFVLAIISSAGLFGLMVAPGSRSTNKFGDPPPKFEPSVGAVAVRTPKPSIDEQLAAARSDLDEAKTKLGA